MGDCVALTGEDEVTTTDCSSADADLRVIAVQEEGTFFPSFACKDVPGTTQVYSETTRSGGGYTLCLGDR